MPAKSAIEKAMETPAMRQYLEIKKQYGDAILFFRMGDFYEMFFDDAVEASEILGIALTSRHKDADIPLAGVPWHAADFYIKKLLEAGKKVAVCEQNESFDNAKRTFDRSVVRIMTPGTVVEETSLPENQSNWLMSVFFKKKEASLCWVDVSCGNVFYTVSSDVSAADTINLIAPRETVVSEVSSFVKGDLIDKEKFDDWIPSSLVAEYLESLVECTLDKDIELSLKQLLFYIDSLYFGNFPPLRLPVEWKNSDTASLDYNTVSNLELEKTLIGGERVGSLLWAIDKTQTPMGKRQLLEVIKNPLKNREKILLRQNCVASLAEEAVFLREIREDLGNIRDFERTLSRILVKKGGPREIIMLASSLVFALKIRSFIMKMPERMPFFAHDPELSLTEEKIVAWKERFIDDPPLLYREGGFVSSTFSDEVAELSDLIHNSRSHIVALEARERENTGIASLKVGFNKVYGYFFEVSKRFEKQVPDYFIRKQTTVGAERYFSAELKELEEKISSAKERLTALELKILEETVKEIASFKDDIQAVAKFIAWLDLFSGFAKLAVEKNYCMPEISDEYGIEIVDGRHPVVEACLKDARYVPASVSIGSQYRRFCLVTGPNMGGKSTLMRMTALIVLLAQTGSFVPAESAKIGIVDAIFTRVGASDNLSKGESTFLVEMKEAASILNAATEKSLIILDEIGRGTGTYDGISLARAIAEYIITKIKATTLFATHYHILTELADDFDQVANFHMTAREYAGRIKFLYQMEEGGSSRSFGVEVAKLTDMPKEVIKNAEKILKNMESFDRRMRFESGSTLQTDIFSMAEEQKKNVIPDYLHEIEKVLRRIDPEKINPREAMNIVFQLFDIIKESEEDQ
ncbi:DNA mismatch repair protein MutS [bacterium]|nr:DNA mismatch repair protein MutS [bacterium]